MKQKKFNFIFLFFLTMGYSSLAHAEITATDVFQCASWYKFSGLNEMGSGNENVANDRIARSNDMVQMFSQQLGMPIEAAQEVSIQMDDFYINLRENNNAKYVEFINNSSERCNNVYTILSK